MSDILLPILVVYLIGVGCMLMGALAIWADADRQSDYRRAARTFWLSPLWPVIAVCLAVQGIRALWAAAEWRTHE